MQMIFKARTVLAGLCLAAAATFAISGASATTILPPGGTITVTDYSALEVDRSDPTLFGARLHSFATQLSVSGVARDLSGGYLGTYDVIAELSGEAWLGDPGLYTFVYRYFLIRDQGYGVNSSTGFSVTGFAGYDVRYGHVQADEGGPYPSVSRSVDGDTLRVSTYDFRDFSPTVGAFVFTVQAPSYRLTGRGSMGLFAEVVGTRNLALRNLPVPGPIPLPAGLPLLVLGIVGLVLLRRRAG